MSRFLRAQVRQLAVVVSEGGGGGGDSSGLITDISGRVNTLSENLSGLTDLTGLLPILTVALTTTDRTLLLSELSRYIYVTTDRIGRTITVPDAPQGRWAVFMNQANPITISAGGLLTSIPANTSATYISYASGNWIRT